MIEQGLMGGFGCLFAFQIVKYFSDSWYLQRRLVKYK